MIYYNKNLGFTLVEALIILAIFSIIASLSAPYFNHFFAQQEANRVVKTLTSTLKNAKNEAAIRHTQIVICSSSNLEVCANNTWNDYLIIFIDTNSNRKIDAHETILKTEYLNLKYGQLTWKAALNSPNIVFNKELGLPIGYNGSFYYCNPSNAIFHKIILSKMGHIRTETISNC